MKNKFLYLLTAIIMFVSCTKNGATDPQPEQATINISLIGIRGGVRALPLHETDVNRIRVLMFRKDGGNYNLKQNEYFSSLTGGSKVLFNTLTGDYNIYYIANEPLAADGITELLAYKDIRTEADIEALELAYATPSTSAFIPIDMPMFSSESNRIITTGTNSYGVNVVRTMAKVYVDLVVDENDFAAGEEVQITSVTLKGLPKYCYMVSAEYPSAGTFTDSEIQTVAPESTSAVHTYKHIFYIPEYILATGAVDNATIEITGRSRTSGLECKWSEPLGDKMGVGYTKYDIRRNTEYLFTGQVKGYGDHEMYVVCKIEDWAVKDITEELN